MFAVSTLSWASATTTTTTTSGDPQGSVVLGSDNAFHYNAANASGTKTYPPFNGVTYDSNYYGSSMYINSSNPQDRTSSGSTSQGSSISGLPTYGSSSSTPQDTSVVLGVMKQHSGCHRFRLGNMMGGAASSAREAACNGGRNLRGSVVKGE